MLWIRAAGSALALLLLMIAPAAADSSVQQLESNVRASLATIGSSAEMSEPIPARLSLKAPAAPQVSELRAEPLIAAVHRLESLAGGWRVNAGISPGAQVLGVDSAGHIVSDHWMNFHVSVGLKLR